MAGKDTDTSSYTPKPPSTTRLTSMSTLHMTKAERERLIKPHLPPPRVRRRTTSTSSSVCSSPTTTTTTTRSRPPSTRKKPLRKAKPIRTFLKFKFHFLVYFLIHIFLGIYIRLRQAYHAVLDRVLAILYYHHRTPELIRKDVKALARLPEHLSAVLSLRREDGGLEMLMDEVAELVCWSACAGIPGLSVYERTGILKSYIPALHQIITAKLATYYGHPSNQPTLHLFAPHHPLYTPTSPDGKTQVQAQSNVEKENTSSLTLLLLSATDGRETLVDLTKTLAEMAQHGKLSPQDISTKLIDAEVSDMMTTPTPSSLAPPPYTSTPASGDRSGDAAQGGDDEEAHKSIPLLKSEPDLLLVFGPMVKLDGYPPWQVRLTEIFCTGEKSGGGGGGGVSGDDGASVEYQRFLKGLWRYAGAEMRFGR